MPNGDNDKHCNQNKSGLIVVPGQHRQLQPQDNGIAEIVRGNRRGIVLTDKGWMRLAVLLIKEFREGHVTLPMTDITEMPVHTAMVKVDEEMGMLEVVVQEQGAEGADAIEDENEKDNNNE